MPHCNPAYLPEQFRRRKAQWANRPVVCQTGKARDRICVLHNFRQKRGQRLPALSCQQAQALCCPGAPGQIKGSVCVSCLYTLSPGFSKPGSRI